MNKLIFEFREPNPNGATATERDVHLFCGRVGKFSTRALQIVRGALDQQIDESVKADAVANNAWQNRTQGGTALAYGRETRTPEVLDRGQLAGEHDPYDPKNWDAERYDPSRYEVKGEK